MPGTTILHLSDLHTGWPFVPEAARALLRAAEEIAPAAVVVSGDLVQRGDFAALWDTARAFVARLPGPLLAVPGNHDIPLWNPVRRALAPFDAYRRHIHEELDPVLRADGVTIAGINTARPWVLDLGFVSERQLERVRRAFEAAPAGSLRVVAMHHPLVPQRETGFVRHHVYGNRRAIRALAEAGVDLVLSGHNHFPKAIACAEYVPYGGSVVVSQAGTATSRRLRPGSGWNCQCFNVIRARGPAGPRSVAGAERRGRGAGERGEIEIEPWAYAAGRFAPRPAWRFPRASQPVPVDEPGAR